MKPNRIIYLLVAVAFLFLLNACSSDVEPDRIKKFSIRSTNTGTNYDISVVLPNAYNASSLYETVYVLDGNSFYLNTDKIAKLTDKISAKYNKQNVIVVGISSKNDRERDFTPTIYESEGGGSESYTRFIEFELIPKIEKEYSANTTAKSRVLIGHSKGGLLTGYFFTKHPDVFNNYLTLGPSFWWDNYIFFKYEEQTRAANRQKNNLVFLGCGELDPLNALTAIEWNYRLTTFYPNCKHDLQILPKLGHVPSALGNAEAGLDFFFKNKP
ncbi:alpha/beta hydrolase [Fibrisoma montanum]|uniref:Alpha/beta hydrolase n=1 Tax=Fibrisoma montanum TaxID=2305895 RepID=A0A418MJ45_9BACT|nr:alpha/beta hydrolase-fold protein [Fibrisoma montanum]RIV27416.1 alpha/beta hydrolase [Fibrisoma montanum]